MEWKSHHIISTDRKKKRRRRREMEMGVGVGVWELSVCLSDSGDGWRIVHS